MARALTLIVMAALLPSNPAFADDVAQQQTTAAASAPASAPATTTAANVVAPMGSTEQLDEIVVNGIRRGDLILPTTVSSDSAFGLDLGVMDTPRNNTLLSKAQLDALNVQNPAGFPTSPRAVTPMHRSAAEHSAHPRAVRGHVLQRHARQFHPQWLRSADQLQQRGIIDIVKGPASVQGGPGAGVGGAINIATKLPSMTNFAAEASLEFDTQQKRIASLDIGGPIASNIARTDQLSRKTTAAAITTTCSSTSIRYSARSWTRLPRSIQCCSRPVSRTRPTVKTTASTMSTSSSSTTAPYLTFGATGGPEYISGFGSPMELDGSTELNSQYHHRRAERAPVRTHCTSRRNDPDVTSPTDDFPSSTIRSSTT